MNTPDYHGDDDGKPTYNRGKKYPAWMIIALPFIAIIGLLFRHARGVCWKAVLVLVLCFEVVVLVVEHIAVMKGYWVYNKARILGPELWGVPIEEPLIYYLFPPVFVVLIFHVIIGMLKNRTE